VVGVSVDKQRQLAEMYRKETGFQFPTLFSDDPRAMEWKNPNAVRYGVTSLPRAILVDQNGVVVETVARGERLFQHLHELLGPPGGSIGGGIGGAGQSSDGDDGSVVPTSFDESVQLGQDTGDAAAPAVPEDPSDSNESPAPAPTVPDKE
jgi:hypothetical protein